MNRCLYYSPLYYKMWVEGGELPPIVIPGHLPASKMPWYRIEPWLREVYRGTIPESVIEVIREMGPLSSYRTRINSCLVRVHYVACEVYDALHRAGLHRVWLVEEEGPDYCRALVAPISRLSDPVLEVSRDYDTGRLMVQDYLGGRWLGPVHGVLDIEKEAPWLEGKLQEILRGLR